MLNGEDLGRFLTDCYYDFKKWATRVCFDPETGGELNIAPFHLEWVAAAKKNPRTLIVCPRGTGKTTIMGMVYPLWLAFYYTDVETAIISNTLPQAISIMRNLRTIIDFSELLSGTLIPDDIHSDWSKTSITTKTNCRIYTRPYSKGALGIHPDYLLADEISAYDDPVIWKKFIVPVIEAKKGHIVGIGTPGSELDLLADLRTNPEYVLKEYAAIDDSGKLLWEYRYDNATLKRLKKEDPVSYEHNFMCNPTSVYSAFYPMEDILDCINESCYLGQAKAPGTKLDIGIDLAYSKGPTGAYSVFTAVNTIGDLHYIRDITRLKGMSVDGQLRQALKLAERYEPDKINVDEAIFGQKFVDDLRARGYTVEGIAFQKFRNLMLVNLRNMIERHQIVLPGGSDEGGRTKTLVTELIHELTSFKETITPAGNTTYISESAHNDMVMSLALAVKDYGLMKPTIDFIATG